MASNAQPYEITERQKSAHFRNSIADKLHNLQKKLDKELGHMKDVITDVGMVLKQK